MSGTLHVEIDDMRKFISAAWNSPDLDRQQSGDRRYIFRSGLRIDVVGKNVQFQFHDLGAMNTMVAMLERWCASCC